MKNLIINRLIYLHSRLWIWFYKSNKWNYREKSWFRTWLLEKMEVNDMIRLFLDYTWNGGNEYYKLVCLELFGSCYTLLKIKINKNEYKEV